MFVQCIVLVAYSSRHNNNNHHKTCLFSSMFTTSPFSWGQVGKLQVSWSETRHGKFHGNSPRGVLGPRTPCTQQTSGEHRTAAAGSRQEGLPAVGFSVYPGPKRKIIVFQPSFSLGFHVQFRGVFKKIGKGRGGFDGCVLGCWYRWYRSEVV